ncbi:unnamed protein product [Spirodela intermedia]|uniref:Uncharacterized protein n=1 Tax=Spirodela intermedia TaxID=51605 RepID=A0A7I8K9C1_SPIIN|nr:unnamed protein product [Spirodela intermedia]
MAATSVKFAVVLPRADGRSFEPNTEALKQRLLRRGVFPTPKIIRTLRKKEIQKAVRRSKKQVRDDENPPLSEAQRQLVEGEALFRTISTEYRAVKEEHRKRNAETPASPVVGTPWERSRGVDPTRLAGASVEHVGRRLKSEHLAELVEMLRERNSGDIHLLLDDDVEELSVEEKGKMFLPNRLNGEEDQIRFLVNRLSSKNLTIQDWKFSRFMKLSGLLFTERNLLRIVDELGALGNWRQALDVVEWVYNKKDYKHHKSRFVYTKLLSILGKSRKPSEALRIFTLMQEDCQLYPDMAAYHSIAVTLGQAGFLKELINVMDSMKMKPSKRPKNLWRRDWDPCLQPDVVIYNAVLNACVASHQWKGVFWVFEKIRSSRLKPNGATYGLAMEVMLESGKYEYVHKFFEKMQKSGLALKALTYKVLVRTFWKEGKIDEAIDAVRSMEQRGVVGNGGVYYELACGLCSNGRWKEAMLEVEKMKRLPLSKSLEVAFTGIIQSAMDGGHFCDCISIFEYMKDHCAPNIGTINAMLKVYGRNDMFAKARDLFEAIKQKDVGSLIPDSYSYRIMLDASANAHQWEYFEYLYREMTLCGYTIDQGVHAWLLLEASRVGKWHLLEHAFDAILEGGDIPHVSLFTEMIIQNVVRENYVQAVAIVNSMAYASINFSEKQWTELFNRSGNRISQHNLHRFLQTLDASTVVAEAPVPNLLNSLQLLCRPKPLLNTSRESRYGDLEAETSASDENYIEDNNGMTKDAFEKPDGESLIGGIVDVSLNLEERGAKLASDFSTDDAPSGRPVFYDDSEASATETALDLLTEDVDFSSNPGLPSASQILEVWREKRMKDGVFPKFQL